MTPQYWLAIAQREQGLLAEAESTLDSLLANQPDRQAALTVKVSLSSQLRNGLQLSRPKHGLRCCVQNRRPNNAIWAISICEQTI